MNEKIKLTKIFIDLFKDDKTPVTHEFVDGYGTIYNALEVVDIIKELFDFDDNQFYPFKYKNLSNVTEEQLDLLKKVLS